jgi:hypothetical protein
MPGDSLLVEALRMPQAWAILIAVIGLAGQFKVIMAFLSILKHREAISKEVLAQNEKLLSQLEDLTECNTKLITTVGLTYSKLLELREDVVQSLQRDTARLVRG